MEGLVKIEVNPMRKRILPIGLGISSALLISSIVVNKEHQKLKTMLFTGVYVSLIGAALFYMSTNPYSYSMDEKK